MPKYNAMYISIHVLREEDDGIPDIRGLRQKVFLSTSSARRTTCSSSTQLSASTYFYPRPPRGGRHQLLGTCGAVAHISIHVLREEDDQAVQAVRSARRNFYPRPPRGGRRGRQGFLPVQRVHFYPRPPRGGRLGDLVLQLGFRDHFYPRPPRGGRPASICGWITSAIFLSTSSARRTTFMFATLYLTYTISIHVLREEDDALKICRQLRVTISIHVLREEDDSRKH